MLTAATQLAIHATWALVRDSPGWHICLLSCHSLLVSWSVTYCHEHSLACCRLSHSSLVALTQAHNKGVRDINFTHNGNFVLAADDTGAVKISTIALKPLQDIKAHALVRGRRWLGTQGLHSLLMCVQRPLTLRTVLALCAVIYLPALLQCNAGGYARSYLAQSYIHKVLLGPARLMLDGRVPGALPGWLAL